MDSTTPVAAVTGVSGAQGAAIARAFLAAGWRVRALTRDAARGVALAAPGIAPVAVPEGDTAALDAALAGAAALVVTAPIDYRRTVREAWFASLLLAAGRAGVGRVVLNLASRPLPGLRKPVSESLRALEAMALAGPVPAAVLRPTVYMDNLLQPWAIGGAREQGVFAYPMAPDIRIGWISHRSLGEAAVQAATRAEAAGRGFDIAGPEALTGPEVAALLGKALGKPVGYAPLDLALLAEGLNASFGAPAGDDIAALYRHLDQAPDALAHGADNAALGIEAETFVEWFARHDLRSAAGAA
ncbi:NmrA family NAD(P)-binding protein [Falsiroseomonas sp. HW251]|uniref:NmrA family NAD(P)-binding protein n=1 Tax=Falsiroseomonas sp. HW251 TaxID=3390998 RepID=UPI003D31613F